MAIATEKDKIILRTLKELEDEKLLQESKKTDEILNKMWKDVEGLESPTQVSREDFLKFVEENKEELKGKLCVI